MLIAFEGIDGAGKSTLAEACSRFLADEFGLRSMLYSEMNGQYGVIAKGLMMEADNPLQQLAAVEYARLACFKFYTQPCMQAGSIALMDRYIHSTIAYQGTLPGLSAALIRERHESLGFPSPAVTFYLRLSNSLSALARMHERGALEKFDRMPAGRVDEIIASFDAQCRDRIGCVVLDAEQPLQQVQEQMFTSLRKMHVRLNLQSFSRLIPPQ